MRFNCGDKVKIDDSKRIYKATIDFPSLDNAGYYVFIEDDDHSRSVPY